MNYHFLRVGEWAIPGYEDSLYGINVELIWKKCRSKTPVSIAVNDIEWYPVITRDKRTIRFNRADVSYPPCICENLPTPLSSPYKCIDGRHRLEKLKDGNYHHAMCFVFDFEELKPLIHSVETTLSINRLEEITKYLEQTDLKD